MCYDIKATYEAQLKRAKRRGDLAAIEEIAEKLIPLTNLPLYHASGFSHPKLLIYTNHKPNFPVVATWGLVPQWVINTEQLKSLWNNTLNARVETLFYKAAFKDSIKHKRCIIYIDGFYEHHHYEKNTYPFYIYRKDKMPLALAGLYSEWTNPNTGEYLLSFSIITTKGNMMMHKIHNSPKLKESRMPAILKEENEDAWLLPDDHELKPKDLQNLITTFPDNNLKAHTVQKLRGKSYPGNIESISELKIYPELEFN